MQLEQEPLAPPSTRPPTRRLHEGDALSDWIEAIARERCESSFRRVFQHFAPRVRTFLRQKGLEERLAQDMTQEVMTRIWLKADQFDRGKAGASTWVYTISRNLLIDEVRKRRRAQIDPNDPMFVPDESESPDAGIEAADRKKALKAAISELPGDQAQVLRMIYIGGMKQQAVAQELSIPLNTVKSRLRLALQKMRRTLEAN